MAVDYPKKYAFLFKNEAKRCFAKLDAALKSGVHIQKHPKQVELFHFLENNKSALGEYYEDFFNLSLRQKNSDGTIYYFLHFKEDKKNCLLPDKKKEYLKAEHLIIALLFCVVYKCNHHSVSTVKDFYTLVDNEYPTYMLGLIQLIAQVKGTKISELDRDKIKQEMEQAFKVFDQLAWVAFEQIDKEKFKVLPAFERIRDMYPEIHIVDELTKTVTSS